MRPRITDASNYRELTAEERAVVMGLARQAALPGVKALGRTLDRDEVRTIRERPHVRQALRDVVAAMVDDELVPAALAFLGEAVRGDPIEMGADGRLRPTGTRNRIAAAGKILEYRLSVAKLERGEVATNDLDAISLEEIKLYHAAVEQELERRKGEAARDVTHRASAPATGDLGAYADLF